MKERKDKTLRAFNLRKRLSVCSVLPMSAIPRCTAFVNALSADVLRTELRECFIDFSQIALCCAVGSTSGATTVIRGLLVA
jgi:hypothetical protein